MKNFELEIKSNKGPLKIQWSDVADLAKYASIQSGRYLENNNDLLNLHKTHFLNWNQTFWDQRQNIGTFDLPNNARILDIGAGASVVDLLLYSYIPNSKFYLVDKEEWAIKFLDNSSPEICFSKNYPFYNSWKSVKDAISTSNFDMDRFVFLTPDSEFPKDVDTVTSYFSYCFHYPKEVYWEKILGSLKKGGKLVLDVRLLKSKDIIGEISEEMKCDPVKFVLPELPKYTDNYELAESGIIGYRCMWNRN
jgi:SAM-dependent methyltransferase